MEWKTVCVVLFAIFVTVVQSHGNHDDEHENEEVTDKQIVKAVVESCGGCRLNRLHEVRSFVYDDVPLFHNVEFDRKPGAPPILYFLNQNGQRVETIQLDSLSRQQCNEALLQRGFYKKSSADDVVPEEYQSGPYNTRTEL